MIVPVPFPRAYVALCLVLPSVWLLGRALAHAVTRDLCLRAVLPIGLTLCLWLSAVHAASFVAGSLVVGLPVATVALGVAGVIVEARRRDDPGPVRGARPPLVMWISMAATAALLAPAALRFWIHDELPFTGHLSTAAAMQNGIYPPRHLAFPELPLRYHYGFDLFVACLTALLRLQVDRAIDVATIVLWCASWCLLWALGERVVGRSAAGLTPLCALLAGGAPVLCEKPGPSLWSSVVGDCTVGGLSVNAPVASYFFQHPWGLGIPIAATIAILSVERRARRPWARLFAIGIALALLSLAEIALFAAVLPSVVAAEALGEGRASLRRGAYALATASLALLAARYAGGFFARVPGGTPLDLSLHAGFANSAIDTLWWNAKSFGLLLPLGVAGLFAMRRGRALFALLAAGSIAVVNGVRFAATADIMKFGTIGAIALGVLASAFGARLLARRTAPRVLAAAALCASATATSVAFLLGYALDVPAIPPAARRAPATLDRDEIQAMTFVRQRARAGETVYQDRPDRMVAWAQWGGVPGPFRSWTDAAFGLPGERLTAREHLLRGRAQGPDAYRAFGITWFVLRGNGPLTRATSDWIRQGKTREARRFGELSVVSISPQ